MSNYEHYQATVARVNVAILRKLTRPWQVQYQPIDESRADERSLLLVAPSGAICQRLTLPTVMAETHWAENEPVSNQVTEYVVRGAARLAPLRQTSYRNNFPYWLEHCLQQLHYLMLSKEQLKTVIADTRYPYPSKVNIEGNFLPCWVWYEDDLQRAVSVIDKRTGLFSKPRMVDASQLVDSEKWFGAQVIDSTEESIETVTYYVGELLKSQKGPDNSESAWVTLFHNPCLSTLSPVLSVALVTGVLLGFFIILKIHLGF